MNAEAKEAILSIFCGNHNIAPETLDSKIKIITAEVYAAFLLFCECLGTNQFRNRNNPFDGFLLNMLHRSSNSFASMVSLIANGHLQDAEVISRTLTESTLAIQFILNGDAEENLTHYLAGYFEGQKWKNDKWQTTISGTEGHPHEKLIAQKNDTELKAKEICKKFVEAAGRKWPEKPRSMSIEKLYKELGKDIEYRTVYRAMCGQSHQNQEDLVNNLLCSLTDNDELDIKSKNEKHSFSVFICLWGTSYFLSAIESLGKYYKFSSVTQQSKSAHEVIKKFHEEIVEALNTCSFPVGWAKSIVHGI
ncbi:hypothetical protein FXN65_17715 [Metapseudomonas lalkuanensis]|uniref:Uncharacterized protein n=1 Tax=Metapseudomonas lalkuanensis TaxID=2604832 RepID=A0A5J6QM03_9GAMM|nr:DUF5677 domain-containing protein [Pseudomonas lalkuanensis]QEY63798.1 hypothetical protein FXN65_17715 [Pseudomonas lalkuanensis]